MTTNLKVGMEVYCDLHPQSRKHVITLFPQNRKGFAISSRGRLHPVSRAKQQRCPNTMNMSIVYSDKTKIGRD